MELSKKNQSFTLIEAMVSIAIIILLGVAFAPNLSRRQGQTELDSVVGQLTGAIFEVRSMAISPTEVTNSGKIMQAWILVLNISNSEQIYCYKVVPEPGVTSVDCGLAAPYQGIKTPSHSLTILAAQDIFPDFNRRVIKQVTLPSTVSIFYNLPCHGATGAGYDFDYYIGPSTKHCPGTGEPYFWKPHFRHLDGAIGFNGKYYNFPDTLGGADVSYWTRDLWSNAVDAEPQLPRHSEMVVISGHVNNPESTYDTRNCQNGVYGGSDLDAPEVRGNSCRRIRVDNITGDVSVY